MLGEILRASDDPGLVECREPHRLRAVKLGILKCGEPDDPVAQCRHEHGFRDVNLVRQHRLDFLRKLVGNRGRLGVARRRRLPRSKREVLVRGDADTEHPVRALGTRDEPGDPDGRDFFDASEKRPLVGERLEVGIKKNRVAGIAGLPLERQGDEIAEATARQGILVREQPVIRREAEIRARLHRLGEQVRAELAGEHRRDRLLEKEPCVRSVARTRTFDRGRQSPLAAHPCEPRDIIPPAGAVKIDRQKKARLIAQHRIHAHDEPLVAPVAPAEVVVHRLVGDRQPARVRAVRALHAGFFADRLHPLVCAGRRIPGPS
jgi:hypothetical protein